MLVPLRLAVVRVRRRLRIALLTALAIAAAAAALAVVLAGSLVAQERSTARALDRQPPGARSLQVAYFGLPGDTSLPTLDRAAREALREVTTAPPVRVLQMKTIVLDGIAVRVRALDGLARWVTLKTGRLPASCTPERCEVLGIAGTRRIPSAPGLRLVVVGTAALGSAAPFGGLGGDEQSGAAGEGSPSDGLTTVLAGSVGDVAALPALAAIYRTYGWVAPLPSAAARPWEVEALTARVDRASAGLRIATDAFQLTAPTSSLAAAASTARAAGHRLLLVGGQIVALLLALAVLAAAGSRRDTDASRRRLTWSGAARWQIALVTATEVAIVVAAGVLTGWLVGSALGALVADAAGAPPGAVLVHSSLSWWGLAAAAGLAVAAAAVILLTLLAPTVRAGRRSVSLLDAAAVAALVAVVVALARGRLTAEELSRDDGAAAVLLLLPGLVAFVAAVACARLLGPALRGLDHATRRRAATVRTAALSLVRNPGHAAIAVSFLAVAIGLTLFAVVYGSTLDRGLEDQARYAVPTTYTVRERLSSDALVRPLRAAPLARWRTLGTGVSVAPVVREVGYVAEATGSRRRYTLLGVPAAAVSSLDGWRDDFADRPLPVLASSIAPSRPVALRGPMLPATATAVQVTARRTGFDALLRLGVLTPHGDVRQIQLHDTAPGVRGAALPADMRGGRVVGFELIRAESVESHRKNDAPVVTGSLALGPLEAVGPEGTQLLAGGYDGWIGRGRVEVEPRDDGVTLRYLVGNDAVSQFRPTQPLEGRPVPALVTPGLAAIADSNGVLALRLGAGRVLVQVAGVVKRFPTADGDAVVVDEPSLFAAGNTLRAGTVGVTELWLSSPTNLDDALRAAPFDVLDVASQRARLDELRDDPLTRGALLALVCAAGVSLLLAAAGLLVLVLSDLRDERGEMFHLEAQGADPGSLRRHLRLRAQVVAAAGLAGGLLTGLALAFLVTATVVVTANGAVPEPPLLLRLDWPLLCAVAAAYLVLVAAVVAGATRSSFRSAYPTRSQVSEP
jgi:hypothetical protein